MFKQLGVYGVYGVYWSVTGVHIFFMPDRGY